MSYGLAILGDNQFLGVNHSDQGKASSMYQRFNDTNAIIEVIGWAYNAGVRDFMFTTHDRYFPVFEEIKRSNLFPELYFTPSLPYAHKFANAMAENGMVDVVFSNLNQVSKRKLFSAIFQTSYGDFSGLMKLLVDVELLMCKGLPVRGVFLLNIVFDLLLGLNAQKILEKYHTYVEQKLKVIPGFFTLNHPAAVDILCNKIGLEKPWLCSNLNSGGFRTNPSKEAVVESFATGKTRNIAMSIFASGALASESCIPFIKQAKGVDSVIFGSSKKENIERNVKDLLHG